MSTQGQVRRYASNVRRRRGVLDLSDPPVENLEQAGGPILSVDQGGQVHQPAGSTQPTPIDVEELDGDVVISSPRAFEEAKQRSRRRTLVADVEAEEVASRLGLNQANKRRRGHPDPPIINRELYVNMEGSSGSMRERAWYFFEYLKSKFLNLATRSMLLHSLQNKRAQYIAPLPPPIPQEPIFSEIAIGLSRNQVNKRRRGRSDPPSRNCERYSKLEESSSPMYIAPPPPPAAPKEASFSCPVCMDPLVEEVTTKCGHIFCKACITAAIKAQHKCPTCRQKLTNRNLTRVYLPITN